ncbi:MAG: hypothetical protein IJL57_04905 [Bacteroidales bacterium]|nr:hypothetical protein [Bacteroidales bacterium]
MGHRRLWLVMTGLIIHYQLSIINSVAAQTQMANRDFEQWTSVGKGDAMPRQWHSYGDADCQLKGIYSWGCGPMTKNHSNRVSGHTGYGCQIQSTSLAGNIVNGVLTTGQMQFASTDNKNPENCTYSDKDNKCGHKAAMAFTGRPDSVYFWCKFDMKKPSNVAVAKFHLHGNIAYRDISTHTPATAQKGKIGNAFCEFRDPNDGKWHQYKFAFTYYDEQNRVVKSATRTPSYILACFSTNKIAKGGHSGDKLSIDEIEMIYNKRLSYIYINGIALPNFDPDRTEYTYSCNSAVTPAVEAGAQSPHARVRTEQHDQIIRIIVTHDDGEKVYTITLQGAVAAK